MLNLIRNEYAKIFRKISTYVILIICLLVSVGIGFLIQLEYDYFDDDYYYEESLADEYKRYENSDDLYDKMEAMVLKVFIDLGYENYSDVPEWIIGATYDAVHSHVIYKYYDDADEKTKEIYEKEYGISIKDIDVSYEKQVGESKLACINSKDYKGYSQKCMEYMDYIKVKNIDLYNEYFTSADYEYHKYIVEKDINPEEDKERIDIIRSYTAAKAEYDSLIEQQKQGQGVKEYELEKYKEQYEVYKYILDNNIKYYHTDEFEDGWRMPTNKFITALIANTTVASMAGIFVMIIAAGIVANEFSNGTIKFLLINPVKRAKIFWSKYITCISLLAVALVSFFIIHLLFSMITCGADGIGGVYVYYNEGVVGEQSIIMYSLEQYLLSGISILVSVTLAFTISSLMRSNAVAIAISVAIEFLGATITLFLWEFGHDWARYLVFANTDLAGISKGQSMFPGQDVGFSFTVLAIYFVIFLLTAYDGFKKKEI